MTMLPAPIAPRQAKKLSQHGEVRVDDYHWLKQVKNPAVIDYLNSENDYFKGFFEDKNTLCDIIFEEIKARIQEDDRSVPYRLDGFEYYSRYETGQQYPILCRKQLDAAGAPVQDEQILLDVNALAQGQPYLSIGDIEVSPDGMCLAYTVDRSGYRQYILQLKDLRTGKLLKFSRKRVTSVAWASDSQTFFYTVEDKQTKRSNQLWRHTMGQNADALIYEERDERFSVGVALTRSNQYLMMSIDSLTSSEVRYLPAAQPAGAWRILIKRRRGVQYSVDHRGAVFYVQINDTGRNYRLVTVPIMAPEKENWCECVPHRDSVCLEDFDVFEHYLVRQERVNGLGQLLITDLRSNETHSVAFSEPSYQLEGEANAAWDTEIFRYCYESMTTPSTIYDYNMSTRTQVLRKRQPVLGAFSPCDYVTERIWAKAKDDTSIPISLVYRRDTLQKGPAPLWLDGYGAYGMPNDVHFSVSRLSLLDRGFIVGVAHVRGGGDLGEKWHDAGRMKYKRNTFTDFIACAEHLIAHRYTTADKLVIEGGSAGGLLVGAVINLRPDLCRVAIMQVPFVDVLTTMGDASLPLTVGEYEEWGNPAIKTHYWWMRAYSPYDNLKPGQYPTMLVKTALNDSQVMYWESAKYVAKLRTLKQDTNPLFLVTNMAAGHGGASGRFDHIRETAVDFTFVINSLASMP